MPQDRGRRHRLAKPFDQSDYSLTNQETANPSYPISTHCYIYNVHTPTVSLLAILLYIQPPKHVQQYKRRSSTLSGGRSKTAGTATAAWPRERATAVLPSVRIDEIPEGTAATTAAPREGGREELSPQTIHGAP